MKLRQLAAGSVLALLLASPFAATAQPCDLGEPVINLMPHLQAMRAELGLNEQQSQVIDAWLAEAPARRHAMEAEACEVRAKLREALLYRAPRLAREHLKREMAYKDARLIEIRSLCARMLHSTLTPEQYKAVVGRYLASRSK